MREPPTAVAMAQKEAETRGKGGWQWPYCCCTTVFAVVVVVVLAAGVEAAEEGMCSGCSVFHFVFPALHTWDSMKKK
jgi:hypothetical protein